MNVKKINTQTDYDSFINEARNSLSDDSEDEQLVAARPKAIVSTSSDSNNNTISPQESSQPSQGHVIQRIMIQSEPNMVRRAVRVIYTDESDIEETHTNDLTSQNSVPENTGN